MATDSRPVISETLLHQVQETARAQNREPSELLEEAWKHYIDEKSWTKLIADGQENAKRLGLTVSDTERLITEYRQERRGS